MKRLIATALLAAGCLAAYAVDPYAGYIYPSGIKAGTTNRFIIGGQALWGVRSVHFGNPGLHVLKIEKVPGFAQPTGQQRKHLKKWLDGIAEGNREEPPLPADPHLDEWRSNSWWRALNTLDAGQIAIVEYDLYTPRNSLQDTPSLRQKILVTVAADKDAALGQCPFYVYAWNGIAAPRPFEVTRLPHAEEPLYVPPHRDQPGPRYVDVRSGGVVLDGQIMPGSTDTFRLRLAGRRRYAFTVTARELQPYIGDAVPGFFNAAIVLKDCDGNVVATADDDARFRPDPFMDFTPPADGEYLLEIHDVLYRGRADFVYSIAIDDFRMRTSPIADGTVQKPGAVAIKRFAVDSPGPRVLEVTARRRGSPLDAVLTLRDKVGGKVLARWDDATNTVFTGTVPQGECDPIGTYDFKEAGEYVAEITDRTGHGGDDYVWWLDIRRPTPGFEVRSTRSTLPLKGGAPLKVEFIVLRKEGFGGDVTIEFPDDVRSARKCVITSGVDRASADLFYNGKRMAMPQAANITASAMIGGRTVRVPVIPCDDYEQAFAWHHLVPAREFLLTGIPGGGKRPAQAGKQKKGGKPQNKPGKPNAAKKR
jgi:hypothetical protein